MHLADRAAVRRDRIATQCARIAPQRYATVTEILNSVLVLLILGLALWTNAARETFAAVAGFIVYGLLLTLVWVQLHGIDVALTEAAIGGGLTGALLISAAARLRGTEAAALRERPGASTHLLALVVSVAVTIGLGYCVLALPDPAPTLARETAANLSATQVGNPITAVLMAFRGTDTLLEAIVLLLALIGVWSLAADDAWGGRPGPRAVAEPNGILAYAARVLPPIGVVVGFYIFWVGADDPGGKFQGATILAAMWLLILMAGLTDTPRVDARSLRVGLVIGVVTFIAIGFAGVWVADAFLAYPKDFAKPLILVIEWALLLSLALTLALLLLGPPARAGR
jgi:multisubunit Na+/H+ antiporter MnhB subunit